MKLQSKISTIILPIVIIPIIVTGLIAYFQLKTISESKTLSEAKAVLYHLDNIITSDIKTAKANLELFSKSNLFKKYITTKDEDKRYSLMQPTLMRLFASYQNAFPAYYEIRIILPDGYEDTRVVSENINNLSEEEGDTDYFKELSKSTDNIFSTLYINPDNNELSYLLSKKILLRDASVDPISAPKTHRGYLLVTLRLDNINKHITENRISKNGIFFITDSHGKILMHPDKNQKGQNIQKNLFSEMNLKATKGIFFKTTYKTLQYLFIGNRISKDLFIFMQLPENEITTEGRKLGLKTSLITFSAILIISLVLFKYLKSIIINPILSLREATLEMGKGNLEHKINLTSSDEIGELANSFEQMADNLLKSEKQIHNLAYNDPLTGLPNRRMFKDYLKRSIERAKRYNESVAVIFIDLDNFKRINDTLSHDAGDELLRQLSVRLTKGIRTFDYLIREKSKFQQSTISRIGGDEFTIVLLNIKKHRNAALVARRELDIISKPFNLNGHEVVITASIGITVFPHDGDNIEDLIKNADIAMYHAKKEGRNNYQFFSNTMNEESLDRLTLEADLRKALVNNEFTLFYQPQVKTSSHKIVGVEALIRWEHPEKGLVSPAKFISVAEEIGVIVPMGEWVIKTACKQMKEWLNKGITNITVSVNISSFQFRYQKVDEVLSRILAETDLPAKYLDIELTESSIMEAEKETTNLLNAIKEIGIKISLDDFGTGYSSLNYLKRFPIDTLKIDRSFIKDMLKDYKGSQIIAAIITLAKCLGLSVVAEGVETEEEFKYLLEKECDIIQGFYFSKPLSAIDVEKLLMEKFINILTT